MAQTNLMTGVLYGAPYTTINSLANTQFKEDTEIFDLNDYIKYRNDLFEKLQKQIGKNKTKKKLQSINNLIKIAKQQAYASIGATDESEFIYLLKLLNSNKGLEIKLINYLNNISQAAIDYAMKNLSETDYNKTSIRREFMYNDFDKYIGKAQKELDDITKILDKELMKPNASQNLKDTIKELLFGADSGSQTLANTAQSKSGIVGEVGGALITGINSQVISGTDQVINEVVSIIGTEGGKADTKLKFNYKNFSGTLKISIKNYKDAIKKTSKLKDNLSTVTVNSGGSLITFFDDFKKQIDPDIDVSSVIDEFNTYWLNVLYFRNFPLTKDTMEKEFEYTRARMNSLLNTYAIVYLMTGYGELNEASFFKTIEDQLLNGKAALFLQMPGVGIIPFFEVLEQIKIGMNVIENPDVTLRFSTPGAQSSIKNVDLSNGQVRNAKASKSNAEKHNAYNQNGNYGGTVNLMSEESPRSVLSRRYSLYGQGVKTQVQLVIRGNTLNSILENYV